jgi:hypothetical protein
VLLALVVIVATLAGVWRFRNIRAIAFLRRSSSDSSGSYLWSVVISSSDLFFVRTVLLFIPVAIVRPLLCSCHSRTIGLFPRRGLGAPDADEEVALSRCPCSAVSKRSSISTPGVSGPLPRGRHSVGGPWGGRLRTQANQQSSPCGHGVPLLMNLHPFIFGVSGSRLPPSPPPLPFPLGGGTAPEESESCPLVVALAICQLKNASGI